MDPRAQVGSEWLAHTFLPFTESESISVSLDTFIFGDSLGLLSAQSVPKGNVLPIFFYTQILEGLEMGILVSGQ